MQAEPGREGAPVPQSGLESLRPRVAGAIAALLVAGMAAAALVAPPAPEKVKMQAAPAAAATAKVPVVEQRSAGLDDGVPTAMDTRRASGGCHHGL